ncbi:MAG: DUF4175 family protein [Gemmatimonadota bacterium]
MRRSGGRLWEAIEAATRRVRRDGMLAVGSVAAVVVPLGLVVAWLAGAGVWWEAPSAAPLVVDAVLLFGAASLAVYLGRQWIGGVGEREIAEAAERWRSLPAGSVRGVLELRASLPAGTSSVLRDRAAQDLERVFGEPRPADLAGELGERARRRRRGALMVLGGATVLAALLGFVSPERSRSGWAPLLSPVAHLSPPPLPALEVRPGDAEVSRGEALEVVIGAVGRRQVTLRWRADGDVPRQRTLDVVEGETSTRIGEIDAPLRYWVVAPDGAASDTFRVRPLDPLLVSDLVVDVVYPAYVERPADRFEGEVPPLEVPQGTEFRIRGRSTRELRRAGLAGPGETDTVAFEVAGERFRLDWTPRRDGVYEWTLTDRRGGTPAFAPTPLHLTVVPDAAPSVAVTFPAVDTVLGPTMRQAIAAQASDDYGLGAAELVSWRVSALGERERPVTQPIEFDGEAGHAALQTVLDASERRLLPGDTLHYYVQVTDNSPGAQTARSETYSLHLPSVDELRRLAGERAESMVDAADTMADAARDLQRTTESLARRASARSAANAAGRSGRSSGSPGEPSGSGREMEYGEASQARQVLEGHEEMVQRIEELRDRSERLEQVTEAAGLEDPELQRRLRELRELYDQILTPELEERLAELRQALDGLDEERVEQALEALAEEQDELRERIDQSLDMLRRAALEQEMNALGRRTRETATQQRALAETLESADSVSPEQAEQQRELTERADSLSRAVEELRRRLEERGEAATAGRMDEVGERVGDAGDAMERAAEDAARQQGQSAAGRGREAADSLERASEEMASARQAMAEGWRQEVEETVAQATGDALELAERQSALLEEMRSEQTRRRGQAAGDPQAGQGQGAEQDQQGQQGQQSGQGQQQSGQGQQQSGQGQQQSGQGQQQSGQGQQQSGQGQQQGGQGQQQGGQGQQQGGQGQQQGGQGQQQSGQGEQQGGQGEQRGGQGRQEGGQGQEQGGRQGGGSAGAAAGSRTDALRSQQTALKEGLERLGGNLAEAGERSALLDRDVGSALGRAMLSMEQALEALQRSNASERMPTQEAEQAVEALNRLALELLANGEQIEQTESGSGLEQALDGMSELAQQQSALNGQANSLLPMDIGPEAMSRQMQEMAGAQREIARRLGGMHDQVGGREDVLGRLDLLSREADEIARELEGGRLSSEVLARQERLFHRLLDAGRTLERDEVSDERVAERPGTATPSEAPPLDPALMEAVGPRYPLPTPEQLQSLPPAYRRLILEYFDRLNRGGADPEGGEASEDGAGGADR